jgi:hypothetical protein
MKKAFQKRPEFVMRKKVQGSKFSTLIAFVAKVMFPAAADRIGELSGEIRTRERLGGLLKICHREAAGSF